MRILLIMDPGIPVPPPLYGGVERQVYQLAEEYVKLGHEVTMLAGPDSYCSGTTFTFGVNNLLRSRFQKNREITFVWKYLLKNHSKFDLVHSFGRLIYLLPILNKPVKKYMCYQRRVYRPGIKTINSLPNKNLFFTACSENCVSTGNVAGNWRAIFNGIDFSLYQPTLTVTADAPLIFLGRLDKIKGVHTAIAVAKATGNKLIIAGNISHTKNDYTYFKTEIEPFIDNDQITYVGQINDDEKNKWLGVAKALLFPIEWEEPFGIVMGEAMACGTPVIGFKRGSVPEVVAEGVSGFIVDTKDEMIAAVSKLSQIDRQSCRDYAYNEFNIPLITQQYLSIGE